MEEMEQKRAEQQAKFERERQEYEEMLAAQQREQKEREEKAARLLTTPQIRNINQDPSMSGFFKYAFNSGETHIGKKNAEYSPQILLTGVGIANKQCTLVYNEDDRSTVLHPNEEDPNNYKVKVNGELVEEPKKLEHGDRILVGGHHYYLFVDPQINNDEQVEWEEAMKEANKKELELAAAADQEEE